MGLFNIDNQRETARNTPASGPPSSFTESLVSAWDATEISTTTANAEFDVYQDYVNNVESVTGRSIRNPFALDPSRGEEPARVQRQKKKFFDEVNALRETNQELPPFSEQLVEEELLRRRQEVQQQRAEVAGREGGAASVGAFIGEGAAAVTDPIVLGSMLFGAGAASSILRFAAVEAGLAGGSEVLVQTSIAQQRARFGEELTLTEAASNVALAAAFGGIGGGIIRGAVPATRALTNLAKKLPARFRNSDVKAAEAYLNRMHEMEDANPFADTPSGKQQHVELFDQAMTRLNGNRANLLEGTAITGSFNPPAGRFNVEDIAPLSRTVTPEEVAHQARNMEPQLFGQLDEVDGELAEAVSLSQRLTEELTQFPEGLADETVSTLERVGRLNQKLAEAKPSKRNNIERQLTRAEERLEELGPTANRALGVQSELTSVQNKIETLTARRAELANNADAVTRQAQELAESGPVPAINRALTSVDNSDAVQLGSQLAEVGQALSRSVSPTAPLTRAPVNRAKSAEIALPEEGAFPTEAIETIDSQIRALADEAPGELIETVDDAGNPRTISARQFIEELDQEEKLLREFEACIKGTI